MAAWRTNEFTLDGLMRQFGLRVREQTDLFAQAAPAPIDDLLRRSLDENVSLALDIGTEKARSELIMPVLLEVRRQAGPGRRPYPSPPDGCGTCDVTANPRRPLSVAFRRRERL